MAAHVLCLSIVLIAAVAFAVRVVLIVCMARRQTRWSRDLR